MMETNVVFEFDVPIYRYEVKLAVLDDTDNKVILDKIIELGLSDLYTHALELISNPNHWGTAYQDGGIFILIKEPQDYIRFLTTLGHECIHASNMILNAVDIKTSNKKDEALTYLFEFIFGKCLTLLNIGEN